MTHSEERDIDKTIENIEWMKDKILELEAKVDEQENTIQAHEEEIKRLELELANL